MNKISLPGFHLAGLQLPNKTRNASNQATIDCGNLWQAFESGDFLARIKRRMNDDVYAVYFNYDGDYTQPYSYFIGCRIPTVDDVPAGMQHLELETDTYELFTAQGVIPDCIAGKWREIWASSIQRAYHYDFEVYSTASKDWTAASVDIFLSVL